MLHFYYFLNFLVKYEISRNNYIKRKKKYNENPNNTISHVNGNEK